MAQHYKKAYKNIKTRAWRVLIWGGWRPTELYTKPILFLYMIL
jgi:hypothetical protein